MILPTTTLASLLAVILGLLCWGSWANAYKISGRWRFEFFYYDFTWGLVLAIAVAAFTLGSMNQQELTFQDIFLLTGYRKMAWALSAGVMLNVGTMLALAAMVLAGMSLAFPVSLGLAAMLGVILGIVENSQGALGLPFAGAVLLTLGVGLSILAYTWNVGDRQLAEQKAFIADPRTKAPPKKASPVRGVVLAVLGAIFLAIGRPMLRESLVGENGVGPYGGALLAAGGMLVSSLVFVPFFLNFPVQGRPEQVRGYFKGTKKQHFLGWLAGIVWAAGFIAIVVAGQAPAAARVNPATDYILSEGAAVLAGCWGLFVWREYKGATSRVQMMLVGMLFCLMAGFAVVGIARTAVG